MKKRYGVDYDCIHNNINNVCQSHGRLMPIMACEELAECIQAISKSERRGYYSAAKEEIADAYISLYALMMYYDIDAETIENKINEKLVTKYYPDHRFMDSMKQELMNNPNNSESLVKRSINELYRKGLTSLALLNGELSNEDWWKDKTNIGQKMAQAIEEAFKNILSNMEKEDVEHELRGRKVKSR